MSREQRQDWVSRSGEYVGWVQFGKLELSLQSMINLARRNVEAIKSQRENEGSPR